MRTTHIESLVGPGQPGRKPSPPRGSAGAARTRFRIACALGLGLCLAIAGGVASAEAARQEPARAALRSRSVDAILEDRVVIRLARSASLAGSEIDVSGEDRRITLMGRVDDETDRTRAERIASRTPGVRGVVNHLEIDGDRGVRARRTDEQIVPDVAEAIAESFPRARAARGPLFGWRVESDRWEFSVEADGGDVVLDGTIASSRDVRRAVESARSVPGVRRVRVELVAAERALSFDPRRGVPFPAYPTRDPVRVH